MIRWVFMDVGNVLMNDDPVMAFLYDELYRAIRRTGRRLTFAELLAEREASLDENGPGHWSVLARKHLGDQGLADLMERSTAILRRRFLEFRRAMPGADEALADLGRSYRLGIIANQLKEVLGAMDAAGWGERFEVRAISELLGTEKPSQRIFEWALEQAGCSPSEAVMVGDRVDNDIAPAKRLGMWTIWLHIPHDERGTLPTTRRARMYLESQRRVSVSSMGPRREDEAPDAEASSLEGLVRAVDALRARSLSRRSGES